MISHIDPLISFEPLYFSNFYTIIHMQPISCIFNFLIYLMKKQIRIERTFNQPISKVWNAISTGEELTKWFMESDFKPEVGYNYTFIQHFDDGGSLTTRGVVLEVQPMNLLSYTWKVDGTEVDGIVKWIIKDMGDSTQVVIEHESLEYKTEEPSIVKWFKDFEVGWGMKLNDLENFIS